ncbi:MAG TPA: NYN domain-containing protein, partial [Herpetosiphonaceae bacterium]|nr:NYN domain-containing protein [Herpetosiphonaceae bacterium]
MNTPKQDVAVFIDFENIYVSVREKFDATPNFEALMERCEDYGRIVVARAYADWYRYPRITSALFANNIEPMYVPTYYYDKDEGRTGRPIKNSVDMHMCIDAMRTLYTRTNISTYVFITGDRDFIALVNCVRQEGKNVVIIGIGGAASSHLAQSADEFLFYEQIVDIRPMGHNSRQMQRVERPDRSERAGREESRPERSNGREGREERRRDRDSRPDRAEKVEKSEAKPAELPAEKPAEKPAEPTPASQGAPAAPIVAIPTPSADNAIYDKLIEALTLARKRGYVSSFGSLKVLMKELMPNFKETRYRNAQGKPFTKFTDFVREAERLGKIQIFTSGTVNEVFLPDEDPYKLSQFAEDLPSVEAERELEQELAAEAEAGDETAPPA